MSTTSAVRILPQPTDTTCGPTCLHALYRFYGENVSLPEVISEVQPLPEAGTLAVHLACHALGRGFDATIYTYNLHVFDPSWFRDDDIDLAERLRAQRGAKSDSKLRFATAAYLEFLDLGGGIRFEELGPSLIRRFLEHDRPILTGLSATYLYGSARERGSTHLIYDDVSGDPTGHFVVLSGFDPDRDEVLVSDPLRENPRYHPHYYHVGIQRVLGAILLGILTYDANFLVIEPRSRAMGEGLSGASGHVRTNSEPAGHLRGTSPDPEAGPSA